MNRKLIRPKLTEYKDKMSREPAKKKTHPPSETYAENYYYLKQMNKKTHVAIVMVDGETIDDMVDLRLALSRKEPGSVSRVVYLRDGKKIEAKVTFSKKGFH